MPSGVLIIDKDLHPNMYLLIQDLTPCLLLFQSAFTSQHVSINSELRHYIDTSMNRFTSQHVSINSLHMPTPLKIHLIFTSQHVSINSYLQILSHFKKINLHPNMYLLIQTRVTDIDGVPINLHPNMYLLIPF